MKRPWFFQLPYGILLGLFLIANLLYIHRVPGLLGDEGSEGENVYELLNHDGITIVGERSYIGPLIDYIRVPYVAVFGYTPLALRTVVLTANVAAFLLLGTVLRKLFGKDVGMLALAALSFSPIFLLQQRIGWAITLNVFFAALLMYSLMSSWKHKWLLAGLVAGLGLSNDIIFLPTLIAIIACATVMLILSSSRKEKIREVFISGWLSIVGFIAGFGTQLTVILLQTDDQGSRSATIATFSDRLRDFWEAIPLYLSGSSYVARYTGVEFSHDAVMWITGILIGCGVLGVLFRKRIIYIVFSAGLAIHTYALLYMVDRYTLRYFTVVSLGVWLLAGAGLGALLEKVFPQKVLRMAPYLVAILLMVWTAAIALVPFLYTGGSLRQFSLGNRNDKASALVDIRPLVSCVRGKGVMVAATQDIFDRLQYLSHQYPDIQIVDGDHKSEAAFTISYKKPEDAHGEDKSSVCPDIPFFRIVKR